MKTATLAILLAVSLGTFAQRHEIDSIFSVVESQASIDQCKSLNKLSWHFRNINVDSAFLFARRSVDIAKDLELPQVEQSAYNALANVFDLTGALDSAEYYHRIALDIQLSYNDSASLASSYNNLGIVYDLKGEYDRSLQHYFQSLTLYEGMGNDPYSVAMVLGNIGIVYKKQEVYEKVLEYYERALAKYEEVQSDFGITVTNGNIGSVLLNLQDFSRSIEYSEKAIEGYKSLGYNRYIPYSQLNLAIAYDSLGTKKEADEYYQLAYAGNLEFENTNELANTGLRYCDFLFRQKKYNEGLSLAKSSLTYARQANSTEYQITAMRYLFLFEKALGNYDESLEALEQYVTGKDSLAEKEKVRTIFELETAYETEKKEQQIALQKAQITEEKAKSQRNRLLAIGAGIIVILLLLVGWMYKLRTEKNALLAAQSAELKAQEVEINATISSQEKERARYARDLHDGFGQFISLLKMNLSRLKTDVGKDSRHEVYNASASVIQNMYEELRRICFDMMPHTLVQHGLAAALQELCARINKAGLVSMELNLFGLENRLENLQEVSIYRIVQEWSNNILKYGNAKKIIIQITADEDEITLVIEDDGPGFEKRLLAESKGHGWKNIQTRTKLINGEIELDTNPERKGTTLILNAPLQFSTARKGELIENS